MGMDNPPTVTGSLKKVEKLKKQIGGSFVSSIAFP
jgi:hypothetical protein